MKKILIVTLGLFLLIACGEATDMDKSDDVSDLEVTEILEISDVLVPAGDNKFINEKYKFSIDLPEGAKALTLPESENLSGIYFQNTDINSNFTIYKTNEIDPSLMQIIDGLKKDESSSLDVRHGEPVLGKADYWFIMSAIVSDEYIYIINSSNVANTEDFILKHKAVVASIKLL